MSKNDTTTQLLYDQTASNWIRQLPLSLSDFTARPVVINLCEPIHGMRILDVGCGEGYCSRELMRRGAKSLYGVDISQSMIEAARNQEMQDQLGIQYEVGCATDLSQFENESFDIVVAVFIFNYLTVDQMQQCMKEVERVLSPSGKFIFSVPHPAFPYMRGAEPPFYFEVKESSYFSARNQQFPGRIWKRDGTPLDVQLVHKTLQDYFSALNETGFKSMPTLLELGVKPEHMELDASFFGPLQDFPLHLAVMINK